MKKTVYKFRLTWRSSHGMGMTSRTVRVAAHSLEIAEELLDKMYPSCAGYSYETLS